jgi:NDP-sugar pyrophosphorylase family protein
MLEITLARLRAFGVQDVIVNAYHFAGKLVEYLHANQNFGMDIEVSREDVLLDTGGGLKKAAHFFAESGEPFLLHNVDVISDIDFAQLMRFHREHNALATLAVQERASSRQLLFDEQLQLCGRRTRGIAEDEFVRTQVRGAVQKPHPGKTSRNGAPTPLGQTSHSSGTRRNGAPTAFAFSGIHVISPQVFSRMTEEGAFSIITTYLRLAGEGAKIMAFRSDHYYWRDLGNPESIRQVEEDLRSGSLRLARGETSRS